MLMKNSKFNDFDWDYYLLADKLMEVFYDDSIKKESISVIKSRLVSDLKNMDVLMKSDEKTKYRKIWWGIYQLILEIDKPQKLIDENKQLRSQINNLKESVNKTEHYWRDIVKAELKEQFDIDKVSNKWYNQLQTNRELTEDLMIKNNDLQSQLNNLRENNKIIPNDDFQNQSENQSEMNLEIIKLKKQLEKKQVPESKTIKKLKKDNKRLQRIIDELKDKYENSDTSDDESTDEEN
jgi:hypothetical protein